MTSLLSRLSHALAALCVPGSVLLCTGAAAAELTVLRTAAQSSTAPKYMPRQIDGKSAIVGLCVDIQRAIERVEPAIVFRGDQAWMPSARLDAEMVSGKIDSACGLSRNSVREGRIVYIEPALFTVRYFLAARADDPVQIAGWDDVRALGADGSILMIHGFGPVQRLRDLGGLTIDDGATDSKTNLLKLVAGRGRFYYHRSPGLAIEIRQAEMAGKIKILPTVMDTQPFYLVVGKGVAPAVRARLARAITRLEASGELKRLVERWFDTENGPAP